MFRTPVPTDLPALSALCLRSKAYWGYDPAFIDACRAELTLSEADLAAFSFQMAEADGAPVGVAAVGRGKVAELELLFIDPPAIGTGLGGHLFDWSVRVARAQGSKTLRIEADPGARSFYEQMGAVVTGSAPSSSVPGRSLPVLEMSL
ncbi:GNAT family N-acetyltransferase [Pseudaestuariivita sp.]|uniref:GNAT family N-acetyltransferase n=1 Tax=Pseudaestuariivita sp. TaxID=2211669 RepID=UPI00405A0295